MKFDKIFKTRYTRWEDIEKAIESLGTTKEEGDAFEQFAFAYFTYFKNEYQIAELYMGPDIPDKYRIKYKLEDKDYGVDGLFILDNGASVSYQVKFRKGHASPSYSDLATFWAESEYTDERCIFANCYELPEQSYKKKVQFTVLRDEFDKLDDDFFEWLFQFATTGNTKKIVKKYGPLDHQKTIINDVVAGFANKDRGKLIAACGTGKTLTALWIKEKLQCKTVLFIAPSLALIKQTLEAWMPQAEAPFSYLCVCSDQTVASHKDTEDYDEEINFSSIPVTTDYTEVRNFIRFNTTFSLHISLLTLLWRQCRNATALSLTLPFLTKLTEQQATKIQKCLCSVCKTILFPAKSAFS